MTTFRQFITASKPRVKIRQTAPKSARHIQALLKSLLLTGILGLSACSTLFQTPSETPQATLSLDWETLNQQLSQTSRWKLIGKIGVRTPSDSVTAAINQWTQADDSYVIDLSSTFFGLGASKLVGTKGFLSISEAGEKPINSLQPDQLIAEALGFPLPISSLPNWIKGIPSPDSEHKITFGAQGFPSHLEQLGWKLTFSKHHFIDDLPLPGKIKLERDDVRIILAIKQWTLL